MDKITIKEIVTSLIDSFMENSISKDELTAWTTEQKLRLIITDSVQAINFIILLEEEFDVEIDDDDISLEFFDSLDAVADAIWKVATDNSERK